MVELYKPSKAEGQTTAFAKHNIIIKVIAQSNAAIPVYLQKTEIEVDCIPANTTAKLNSKPKMA